MYYNYTDAPKALRSILTILDEGKVSSSTLYQWIIDAVRLMNLEGKYEENMVEAPIENHVLPLPPDVLHLVQVKVNGQTAFLGRCNFCDGGYFYQPKRNTLVFNVKNGKACVVYKAYPRNEEGEPLLLDDPFVIEAVKHYVLYNYYLADSQFDLMRFHLDQWSLASRKALSLNLPDLPTLNSMVAHQKFIAGEYPY